MSQLKYFVGQWANAVVRASEQYGESVCLETISSRLVGTRRDDILDTRVRDRLAVSLVSGYAGRLRKRASWVNRLSYSLGLRGGALGAFLCGRWKPDLLTLGSEKESSAYWAAILEFGARVEGFAELSCKDGSKVWASHLSLGSVRVLVIPELVARLSVYASYRKRDANLVSALKLRALEWCKEKGLLEWDLALSLPASVALACLRNAPELSGIDLLRSNVGMAAAKGEPVGILGALAPYASQGSRLFGTKRDWYLSGA